MPDFAQFYGLRLTEVATTYEPCEAVQLIAGLPGSSRYAARLSGEKVGAGWESDQWLMLDMRNAIEGLRATVANMAAGKNRATFRQWDYYPGHDRQAKNRAANKLDRFKALATPVTE